jgi:hypothetical protein
MNTDIRSIGKATTVEDLPNELLQSILKLAHDGVYAMADRCGNGAHPLPVEVAASLVCKRWRDAALNYRELWSVYQCIRPLPQRIQYEQARLQEYLKRSGDSDLELCFRFEGLNHESSILSAMLASTLEHASRWRRLVLTSDGDEDTLISFHQPLKKLSVPKLQYLDVRTARFHDYHNLGWDTKPNWNPRLFFAEVCPSFEFLRLDVSAALARYRPRFENLVHFCFEPGPSIGVEDPIIIPNCFINIIELPSIETISLWGSLYGSFHPNDFPALEAKRLRHFRVGGTTSWGISTLIFLMHQVTAPVLESITIQSCDFSGLRFQGFHPRERTLPEYSFPSFQSLYLIDVIVRGPNDSTSFFSPLLGQLATRTRRAKSLTLSFSEDYSLSAGLKASGFQLCPETEDLVWNSPLWGAASEINDLKDYWPKLARIHFPPHFPIAFDAGEIEVHELKMVGQESWPPGYEWASSDREDDPFFYVKVAI